MKDLKIQYWSQNRLQTKSYNTIMDFLDNDENTSAGTSQPSAFPNEKKTHLSVHTGK